MTFEKDVGHISNESKMKCKYKWNARMTDSINRFKIRRPSIGETLQYRVLSKSFFLSTTLCIQLLLYHSPNIVIRRSKFTRILQSTASVIKSNSKFCKFYLNINISCSFQVQVLVAWVEVVSEPHPYLDFELLLLYLNYFLF